MDGRSLLPAADATVVVRGDRLVAVGPAASIEVPPGARVIDLGGATFLPGLINAHVHAAYGAERLRALARGADVRGDGGLFRKASRFEVAWELTESIARERHCAINWLTGQGRVYSRIDTST